MCNYPRLYCTNGENVPDLLNGQQRLNPVRADSVTMVITVAFLVLAPLFFYISNPPKSGQNNGRNYFTAIIEIQYRFDSIAALTVSVYYCYQRILSEKGDITTDKRLGIPCKKSIFIGIKYYEILLRGYEYVFTGFSISFSQQTPMHLWKV